MVAEERKRNNDVLVGKGLKTEVVVNNGFLAEFENGGFVGNSGGSSRGFSQTYQRRKHRRTSSNLDTIFFEDGKFSTNSASQLTFKTIKEPLDIHFRSSSSNHVSLAKIASHASTNDSDDCSAKDWRKIVLEEMYQSLNESDGLKDCIRDALVFHPEGGCTTKIKESFHFGEKMQRKTSQTGLNVNGTQNAYKGHVGVISNESTDESSHCTNTYMCRRTLIDVLISKKFADLCDLLFGKFQGMKVDSVFDLSVINSRIKEGAYESSPMLFHSDLQQVWAKLQMIGTEMVALANRLSEKSTTSYHDEFLVQESDGRAKSEQTEGCCQYRICTCRYCGEKAEGRDCLVCDYCEEMYHVLCIKPAVEEIPLQTWYCTNCRAKGIASPHENCVVCERINASRSPKNGIDGLPANVKELELVNAHDLEEDGLLKERENLPCCNICHKKVENDDKLRECGHSFCLHRYYHERCLTVTQLNSYGPCWYCPSCLCRGCLTDRDDDKIVLCDGCDQAFHIYCMQPPQMSIPEGKWFCRKCDEGIHRIHAAKRAYMNVKYELRERVEGQNVAPMNFNKVQKETSEEDLLDKSGGVDMLLTAAKTLNYEENLAALD